MPRPVRTADAETVRQIAKYAGLRLAEDRIQVHVNLLNELVLPYIQSLEGQRLGFWFEEGRLTFVRGELATQMPWEGFWDTPGGGGI